MNLVSEGVTKHHGGSLKNTADNKLDFILKIRPLFDEKAVFSDETAFFRTPSRPKSGGEVQIRIRTAAHNVDQVFLLSGSQRILMEVEETREGFDYYRASVRLSQETLVYYFEIRTGRYTLFYNKGGVSEWHDQDFDFTVMPDFYVPEWSRGAVMYQIFPDRFRNGNPENDVQSGEYLYMNQPVEQAGEWNEPVREFDVGHFYGGDLQGIMEKLDYLENLGVEVLYLNPIFVSPSNHKYDTQDYDHVDPHLAVIRNHGENENQASRKVPGHALETDPENLRASDQYFIRLVEEIHRRGMRIILDGVFNHCGSFNKWMDREGIYEGLEGYPQGAYHDAQSPYRSYFKFHNENEWPDNRTYVGWWGMETLPKLNYEESPELVEHIYRIAEKWVSPPYNVDGWRLDVAADLGGSREFNHIFWKGFRKRVRKANPEALILAEHYGNPAEWLQGDEWDTVMNYDGFMEPVSFFLTGMEKHSDACDMNLCGNGEVYFQKMKAVRKNFSCASLQCAMNELDNHDHSRFLTRTNHKIGRLLNLGTEAAGEDVSVPVLRQAVVMQMTWPGAPTVYYGDEAGQVGFTDPDSRRTYPWGHENQSLIEFYRLAIGLHKSRPVLRDGSLLELLSGENMAAYGRFDEHEAVVTVVNTDERPKEVSLPVWELGLSRTRTVAFRFLLGTDEEKFGNKGNDLTAEGGILKVTVPPHGALVYGMRK